MRRSILVLGMAGCALLLLLHFLSGRSALGDIIDEVWPLYLAAGTGLVSACLLLNAPQHIGWPATITSLVGAAILIAETEIWQLSLFESAIDTPTESAEGLRVATFNVWASNTDLDATVDYLIAHQFDLISAQEVGGATRALPARLRQTYPNQFTCGRGVYVFSRQPFIASGCPDTPQSLNRRVPAAWVDVVWNDEAIRFVALHLARPMEMRWRRPQISRLEAFIADHGDRPMIMAGDFNAGHAGRSARELQMRFAPMARRDNRRPSWPSARMGGVPLLALDQIWLSEDLCLLQDGVGPALGSDHRPITGLVSRCGTPVASPASR